MTTKIEIVNIKMIEWNGITFPAFRCKLDGKYYDLKFQKGCALPQEKITIECEEGNWNINERGKYPVVWVKSYSVTFGDSK